MSLLTQFYPGTSGGGGNNYGGAGIAGAATLVLNGYTSTLSTGGGTTWAAAGPGVYVATSGASLGIIIGGGYTGLTLNNLATTGITLVSGCEFIQVNGGVITTISNGGLSLNAFQGLYGSGVLGGFAFSSPGSYSSFTTISTGINIVLFGGASSFAIRNAALNATTVNHILTSLVAGGAEAYTGLNVGLFGGTSAGTSALTAAGIAARDALVAAGWTVVLNA